jgi:hypothetical protein
MICDIRSIRGLFNPDHDQMQGYQFRVFRVLSFRFLLLAINQAS